MIFQTFDKGFAGWTSKIGILNNSFHDLGTAIRSSFQSARDAIQNTDTSTGFLKTFRENLGAYTTSNETYRRNSDKEIVTSENIDTYIPKLTKEEASNKLADLRNWQEQIQNNNSLKWSGILSPEIAENKYLLELIRNTEDLSELTGDDLVTANQRARAAVLEHNEAVKAQTLSAKTGKVALQGLATAGGMVAGFLIAKGIELAATAIDNLIHQEERLAEAAKEASENIQNSYSSFSDEKQSIGSITSEFAELSQHVNQHTGKNEDLSSEEYERYLELSNQLAETFPDIGYTLDENGNKITGLSGTVDEITQSIDSLIQAEQQLSNQEINNNIDDVFKKSLSDLKGYTGELDKSQSVMTDVKGGVNRLLNGETLSFNINSEENLQIYKELQKLFEDVGLKLNYEFGQLSLNYSAESAELTEDEIKQIKTGTDKISENFVLVKEDISQNATDAQNNIQTTLNSLAASLNPWLATDSNYSSIVQTYGSDLGTAIQLSVNAINWAKVDGVNNWGDAQSWITDNILAPLNNADNDEIRQAYTKLFTDTELPLDSAMEYLAQIKEYYHDHDLSIPVIFTKQEEEFSELQEKFNDRNASFQTGDLDELNQFFQENNIDEADEYEKWCSVTEGITDATEAMETWKRTVESTEDTLAPLSFQESWDSLGTTGSNNTKQDAQEAKEQLLELAKIGKLTEEAFNNSPIATQFMKDTGLSAEEATQKINNLVESTQQLSSMKIGITAITSAYDEKKESKNNSISAGTLDSMRNTLEIDDSWNEQDLKVWEKYKNAATDASMSLKDFKKYQDDLATSYVNSGNFLANLTEENQKYYDGLLMEMGITNAHKITTKLLADSKKYLGEQDYFTAENGKILANATSDEIQKFIEAEGGANKVSDALLKLAIQKELCNDHVLDFSGDCTNLLNYVNGLGGTTKALRALQAAQNKDWATVKALGYDPQNTVLISKLTGDAEKEAEEARKKQIKTNTTSGNKSNDSSTPKSNSPSESNDNKNEVPKETKQSFDWLDRYVTVLTQRTDLLKAKLENLFSVKAKNSNLTKQIKAVNKEMKAYSKEASIYAKKAKTYAKENLSNKIKKNIDNGKIKGKKYGKLVQEYGEENAQKIQKYMDLKDKSATAKQNKVKAQTTKRELKIQKHQNKVDKFDALSDKYDAQIENAKTAKDKNDLETKKLTYTKNSYKQQIKIAKLEYGKNAPQVAKLKAEKKTAGREIKIETQQNLQDEADANRNMLEAQMENATSAKAKNIYLAKEVQYIAQSYDAQIKIAKLEGNVAKQHQLEAEKQKELLENKNQQLQNLSDEHSAQYNLNQQLESNAKTAAKKNQYEAASRENLKSQYAYEIQIAHNNGDITEEKRLQAELEEKIAESYKQEIENLKEEYDLMIGIQDARKSTIDSQISALQANGYNVAAELYKEQQEIDLNNYNETLSKISDITAEMQNLDPESQDYKNYLMDLESYKQEAWGYQQAWAEAQQAINDINLSKIEHVGTLLGYQANQLEHIQNILGHSDFTLSDKDIGGLTIEGLSSAAMTLGQMKNNSDQIANKWDQIAEINRQIDAKEYVGTKEQAEEDIYNLLTEIEELEEANYDFGESIKNMVIDSLNSLSDALDESISKYKDALTAQKDLYDYRKKVASQLKSIASLEKQLTALQGSQSEETRARIQQLKISLDEANDNLKETEYEKYIQDQEEILDKVSDDFQDFIANVTDMSVSEICAAVGNAISDHKDDISQAIKDAFAESDAIKSVADNMKSLGEIMSAIDFSTNITLNTDSSGKVTGMSVNGEEIDVPGKDNGMSTVANDIDNASTVPANQKARDGDLSNTSTSTTTTTATTTTPSITAPKRTDIQKKIDAFIPGKLKTKNQLGYSNNIVTQRKKNDPATKYLMGKYSDKSLSYTSEADLANSLAGKLERLPADFNPNITGAKKLTKYGNALLSKLKNAGFSKGGMVSQLNKVAIANGDEGWATLKRGESVLTPAQTEQFRKLTENLFPLNTMAETIASLSGNPIPTTPSPASTTTVRNVDIHLDGSHVMDADSFIQTLHNPRVLQEISSGVSSQLGNVLSNKLGTF